MRVFVYYNLHRKLWSIKALEGENKGRVIAHSNYVLLADAHGKVSEAGRQRVLREKRKNVHAGIVGTLAGLDAEALRGLSEITHGQRGWFSRITYNPYKYESFVHTKDERPFDKAPSVFMQTDREVFAQIA